MNKRASRQVKIGNKVIGGGAPVLVQSMLNVPSEDYEKNGIFALIRDLIFGKCI